MMAEEVVLIVIDVQEKYISRYPQELVSRINELLVLQFIRELAEYEKMQDEVVADAAALSGAALTGIARASTSIFHLGLSQ